LISAWLAYASLHRVGISAMCSKKGCPEAQNLDCHLMAWQQLGKTETQVGTTQGGIETA
jgi:hypothetical protein